MALKYFYSGFILFLISILLVHMTLAFSNSDSGIVKTMVEIRQSVIKLFQL